MDFTGVSDDGTLLHLTCCLSSFFILPPLNRLHSGDFQSELLGETKQMSSTTARINDEAVWNMRRTSSHMESREGEAISRGGGDVVCAQCSVAVTNRSLVLITHSCLARYEDTLFIITKFTNHRTAVP